MPSIDSEGREISLFEKWMGITPDEWNALGAIDVAEAAEPATVTRLSVPGDGATS